jgi:O-antigen ligase
VTQIRATCGWFDRTFWGELIGLGLAAPFFYFPSKLPIGALALGFAILAATWGWRKRHLGCWFVRTPADWALALLLLLLPIALWVAPRELRAHYADPRALILLWNIAFFSAIVVHSGRGGKVRLLSIGGFIAAGSFIAVAALFGTRWDAKVPVLTALLEQLPQPLAGVFSGAENGFSPNQLAGTLLYVLPVALAWLVVEVRRRRWAYAAPLAVAAASMGIVMLATQSRAGLIGLAVSLAILLLWPRAWGRWLFAAITVIVLASLFLLPIPDLLIALDDTTKVQGVYGSLSIAGRMEIWSRALAALRDFQLTGIGLGSFRVVVHQLYPLFLIPGGYDIAHAHNFFLQTSLDFGLLGLVALLAVYMAAVACCIVLWRTPLLRNHAAWAIGLLAALLGQAVYSLADAVTMGSKTNVLFWWLLAVTFGITAHRRGALPADLISAGPQMTDDDVFAP